MKKAWTMAEFTVAMLIVIVLSLASISSIKKTSTNKDKLFMYATMKNIMFGNGAIIDKYGEFHPVSVADNQNWYCKELNDVFSLTNSVNCSSASATFEFANGTTISGLAANWQTPYTYKSSDTTACVAGECEEAPDFYYKNILVDINGAKKPDKLGIDRFPLRIYTGFNAIGTDISGIVAPACGTYDKVYDPVGNIKELNSGNNYCSSDSSFNFIEDNEIVSYNIYRIEKAVVGTKSRTSYVDNTGATQTKVKDKAVNANMVLGQLSYMKADCLANGGNGIFNKIQCSSAGYKLHQDCANYDLCKGCSGAMFGTSYNVCPSSYSSESSCQARAATLNADTAKPDTTCYVVMNKPLNGLGFFAGLVLGDIDI